MKQLLNKKFLTLFVLALPFILGSCLKNNKYDVDFGSYEPSIQMPLAAANVNNPVSVPLDVVPEPQDFRVYVNIASMDKPTNPITATIALDEAYLDQYNAEQDAIVKDDQADYLDADTSHKDDDDDYPADYEPYLLFPDSLYTMDKMQMTVAAGERQAYVTAKIVTAKMDFSAKYVLPFTITNVDPDMPISNWKHLMLNIQAKNDYDGSYTNTYSSPTLGAGSNTVTLTTISQTENHMGLIGVYSNDVYITTDPGTFKVTVDVPSLQPTVTDPSSHWDPATSTFYLDFNAGGHHIIQTMVKK